MMEHQDLLFSAKDLPLGYHQKGTAIELVCYAIVCVLAKKKTFIIQGRRSHFFGQSFGKGR